ncbi:MAG: hypothetical protein AAB487_01865 [Patescibacteria group bacterium]
MYSNLKNTVKNLVDRKKIDWSSFRADKVRDIERELDNGKISIEDAIGKLKDEFGSDLGRYDYQEIKKALERR